MRQYFDSIGNFLLERSAEELIVAVFLALALGFATAGIHALLRSRVKDNMMILTVMGLLANVLAMLLAAGYLRMDRDRERVRLPSSPTQAQMRMRGNMGAGQDATLDLLVSAVFDAADVDHDGRVSPAEASRASGLFVEAAERRAGSPVDRPALVRSISQRLGNQAGRHPNSWGTGAPGMPAMPKMGPAGHPSEAISPAK